MNCVVLNREEHAEEVTEKMFDEVFDINLKGAMFQVQAVVASHAEAGNRRKTSPSRIGPDAARIRSPSEHERDRTSLDGIFQKLANRRLPL